MRVKKRFIFLTVFVFFISSQQVYPQSIASEDLSFDEALQKYLNKNLLTFGKNEIARERYLIQQMRDINEEMKSRVKDVGAVRDQYFIGLLNRLEELDALRTRLGDYNSASLNAYIDQLDKRIRVTIDEGEINYRRQKVFEDGIQVLYIAEEMLKLDPGASAGAGKQLDQQIQESNQKLLNTFGDAGKSMAPVPQFSAQGTTTIWDLFAEWRRTNRLQYEARLTDIKIVKSRMLKNGTAMEKERMFKRELQSAVLAYNFRNYDLADRLFEEILITYNFINTLDDVYYFKAESNYQIDRYSSASTAYLDLVTKYPASAYTSRAYARLVMIAHHFGDAARVSEYYNQFEKTGIGSDPLGDQLKFVAGVSAVSGGAYEQAVTILNSLLPASEFYIDGRYVLAQAYAGSRNFEEAKLVLQGIVTNYNTPPNYHYNVYLKLAYLNYQLSDFPQAIYCLDQIGNDFALYDRVLMAYAWNYYKMELTKPDAERNFEIAKKYVEVLTQEFSTSDFFLEAKTLMAYIYQVEKNSQSAITQYEYVYESGHTKNFSDASLRQSDRLKSNLYSLEGEQDQALQKNEQGSYFVARDRYLALQDSMLALQYAELSPNSIALQKEISRIESQIQQLEKLRELAIERNSPAMLKKIDDLNERLAAELEDAREMSAYSFLGTNYYDEHPLARKESLTQDQRKKILAMRTEVFNQEKDLEKKISDITAQIERAKSGKNYKQLVFLEIEKDQYNDLLKSYDFFHTLVYELDPSESEIQLDKWSNYGAFGIANVNFSVRLDEKNKVAYYSRQIDTINQILNNRKSLLDYKINQIDGEINYMTRKVRRQERLRERAEMDRKFQESYFDTHTSEIQSPETQPPDLNEEEEKLPENKN
jgi:TolA-binding protein